MKDRARTRLEEMRAMDVRGRRGSGILPLIPFPQSALSRTGAASVAAPLSRLGACGGDGGGGWARAAAGDAAKAAHTRAPSQGGSGFQPLFPSPNALPHFGARTARPRGKGKGHPAAGCRCHSERDCVTRQRDQSQPRDRRNERLEETRPADVHRRRGSGILPLIPFPQKNLRD